MEKGSAESVLSVTASKKKDDDKADGLGSEEVALESGEERRETPRSCLRRSCAGHRQRCLYWGLPITILLAMVLCVLITMFVWNEAAVGTWASVSGDDYLDAEETVVVFRRPSGYHEGDVASPSIAKVPGASGVFVASNDVVAEPSSQVHLSEDGGKTWTQVATVDDAYWCSLFFHRGPLYMLCTTREYGDVVIRRSGDLGRSWTEPTNSTTGLLTSGERWHRAPTPVVSHNGRLWHALEEFTGAGQWAFDFEASLWSADEAADLLNASSWRRTNNVPYPWNLHSLGLGFLEGNAVVDPAGGVAVVIRVHALVGGYAALLTSDPEGRNLTFRNFFGFPGGEKKFMIRYDEQTGRYWAMSNPLVVKSRWSSANPTWRLIMRLNLGLLLNAPALGRRNALAILSSEDLLSWDVHKLFMFNKTINNGFQYPDFAFDGDDLVALLRVAHPYEDVVPSKSMAGNLLTCARIANFRDLLDQDDIMHVRELGPHFQGWDPPLGEDPLDVEEQVGVEEELALEVLQDYIASGAPLPKKWRDVISFYKNESCRAC